MFETIVVFLKGYPLSWQIVLAVICLAIYCLNRFNTWTEVEVSLGKESPPRHYTTKNRYTIYAVLYTLTIEVVYLLLLSFPGVLIAIDKHLKIDALTLEELGSKDFPLVLLVIAIAVVPNVKPLRKGEAKLRTWFHRQAFIPSQAGALVNQLLSKHSRFSIKTHECNDILEDLQQYLPENNDPLNSSHDIWHKWFKLLCLRKKINEWQQDPRINQFSCDFGKAFKENQHLFNDLERDLKYYARRNKAHMVQADLAVSAEDREYINREEDNLDIIKNKLNKEIDHLLKLTYEYICCGILSTERSKGGRIEKFEFFHLYPVFEEQLPFVADSLLMAMLFVFTVTSLTSMVYHYMTKPVFEILRAFDVGMIHTIMQGFCIFIAYFIYRNFERAGWLNPRHRYSGGVVVGPLLRWTVSVAISYVPILFILIFWMTLRKDTSFMLALEKNWFWPIPVAVTTSFIIYYLSTIRISKPSFWRDGLIQALVQGAAGFFVASIAVYELNIVPQDYRGYALIGYITLTLSLTGWCIGRVFPSEYSRALQARHIERRTGRRVNLTIPTAVIADKKYSVEKPTISTSGAGIPIELSEKVGESLQLDIPGIGSLVARIIRKAAGTTYLAFNISKEQQDQLSDFLQHQPG
jgi:hypothetical protein